MSVIPLRSADPKSYEVEVAEIERRSYALLDSKSSGISAQADYHRRSAPPQPVNIHGRLPENDG
jgi:hypothetical protein